jgi:glycine/D-amino acid oxidase-like deaminating enzyme/nitrite reductase/ring-hydroxylating ferredoxin subunit
MTEPTTAAREGARTTVWEATLDAPLPSYPRLDADLATDVCVVGAGIAGLTVAYQLARAGRQVVVLDDGPLAGGETGRTTAHVVTAYDDFYHEAERLHGEWATRLLAESFRAAVDEVARVVREEAIACDFVRLDGYWFPGDDEGHEVLRRELAAARRAGLADVSLDAEWPITTFRPGNVLRFPNQAQFHILKYVAGLARAAERHGARLFSGAHVVDVEDGAPCTVRTDGGRTVRAASVVVATNTPVNDRVTLHTKQAPYRTYVIGARVPRGAVPLGLYWDTLDPYHYVRLLHAFPEGHDESGGTDVLLVGGEDHKTGQGDDDTAARFEALEQWTRARFPVEAVEFAWSGQVMEPVDGVAYIGRNPGDRNVYVVTGDSGNGMTNGTLAGLIVPDLILGRESRWAALYDPSRVTLAAAPEWVKENVNVAGQYADHLTPGEVDSPDDVPPGEGRVLRRGAQKLAAYRAPDGALTLLSATCTHLYCVVEWNGIEKTWDCPCHGSRFAPDGAVINGPAIAPLPPADD